VWRDRSLGMKAACGNRALSIAECVEPTENLSQRPSFRRPTAFSAHRRAWQCGLQVIGLLLPPHRDRHSDSRLLPLLQ
jgi:hypothetical protein